MVFPTRSLRTGTELSCLGFGGAPLGELSDTVSEDQAQDTLAVFDKTVQEF